MFIAEHGEGEIREEEIKNTNCNPTKHEVCFFVSIKVGMMGFYKNAILPQRKGETIM